MIRGGSWNNKPDRVRSANRNRNNPDNRNNNIGFRLASIPADARFTPGSRNCRVYGFGGRGVWVSMILFPGLAADGKAE